MSSSMMATKNNSRKRAPEHTLETKNKRASAGTCFSVSIDKDTLEEILSKLPVKSLIRFKCVSQEWCALIKNPSFITKQHLSSCSDPADMYIFVDRYPPTKTDGEINKYGVYEVSMVDRKSSKFTRLDLSTFANKLKSIHCVASSNGLVCFFARYASQNIGSAKEHESIIVCNPATKQFRSLPIPNPFIRNRCNWPLLGFEFSHDTGEYKLVSIYPEPIGVEEEEVTFRVQVLTQSSNSWRRLNQELKFPTCKEDCFTLSSVTSNNGVLYWLVRRTHTNNLFVLSFSLRNEVFMHVIPLPPVHELFFATSFFYDHPPTFLQWKNSSPALLLPSPVVPYYVLWVMKTTSTETPPSWTRQFRIKLSSFRDGFFMGFSNDHQYWIFNGYGKPCVLYDPATNKQIKFRKHETNKEYRQVINYVQSLLPVLI